MSSSWFSLSLPSPFNSDDEQSPPNSPTATAVARKPDISALTQTIGRQLHNVASFLAPPPQPSSSSSPPPLPADDSGDISPSCSGSYRGIKNDLSEISGSLKTSLSLLSSNRAVSEISKFASNLLQFDKGEDVQSVGITDEIVNFVGEISCRPECWIDFPLSLQHKDFNMSDAQKDHTKAIQELVPYVTDLRHKIHAYMTEQQFWMIYFILLLPRLTEDDYRLLSTPEIIQARETLLRKLRNKNKTPVEHTPEKGSLVNNTGKIENLGNPKPFQHVEEKDVSGSQSGNSETGDWVCLTETSGSQEKAGRSKNQERRSESEESSDWLDIEDADL